MESIRSKINYVYEEKLIHKSGFHYLIPAVIGLVFGQLAPVISGICISASLGEVPFSALSTVEPIAKSGLIGVGWATSGGEAAAMLGEKYLAADGIENVIRVLEEKGEIVISRGQGDEMIV